MLRGLYYDLTIGVIGIPVFCVDNSFHHSFRYSDLRVRCVAWAFDVNSRVLAV